MLPPIDKAKELIEKYLEYMPSENEYYQKHEPDKANARDCAIIAVDMRLEPFKVEEDGGYTILLTRVEHEYWTEVKECLEKMRL